MVVAGEELKCEVKCVLYTVTMLISPVFCHRQAPNTNFSQFAMVEKALRQRNVF